MKKTLKDCMGLVGGFDKTISAAETYGCKDMQIVTSTRIQDLESESSIMYGVEFENLADMHHSQLTDAIALLKAQRMTIFLRVTPEIRADEEGEVTIYTRLQYGSPDDIIKALVVEVNKFIIYKRNTDKDSTR